ncbi:hypothetical protein BpHYR1_005691, partial [Brachionus plicatilis]
RFDERSIVEDCKNNPKRIFSYVNNQKISKDKIRSLINKNGELVNNKEEIANILNNQFQQAFSLDDG